MYNVCGATQLHNGDITFTSLSYIVMTTWNGTRLLGQVASTFIKWTVNCNCCGAIVHYKKCQPQKVGGAGTKHRASPPLQKVGGTCPPVHPRIYAHEYYDNNVTRVTSGDTNTHKTSLSEITVGYKSSAVAPKRWTQVCYIRITVFITELSLMTKIGQKFISATSQGVTR